MVMTRVYPGTISSKGEVVSWSSSLVTCVKSKVSAAVKSEAAACAAYLFTLSETLSELQYEYE